MISICIGIKNRTDNLINYLIASMNKMDHKDKIQLSVFDCESNDVDNLKEEIKKHWTGSLIYTCVSQKFTRTKSFNKAIKQTDSDDIFICDADMTLPVDFYIQYKNRVNKNAVWFPICFSLYEGYTKLEIGDDNGWWRTSGYGMLGIKKEDFITIGMYDESNITWGKEDDHSLYGCRKHRFIIHRDRCVGLFHSWHERDTDWHKSNTI